MQIGAKIKELRKKKDMTQEKLAEYLNVSFQAVSKWETETASPDLPLLVALAKLFGVTTDELLGVPQNEDDKRMQEITELWQETWETGDVAKRYELSRSAVELCPGNFEYLVWLADAEAEYATHCCERDSAEQRKYREKAAGHYETVIEDCQDKEIHDGAIYGAVLVLGLIDRIEDAKAYAMQHPKADELLRWCLTGEELQLHRRRMIFSRLVNLIVDMEWGHHDLPALQAAETIIKTVVDDRNYLWFHDTLMHNYIWQAQCLTRDGRFDEAVERLKKSYSHACELDNAMGSENRDELKYTCSILKDLPFIDGEFSKSGTATLTEDFQEYLSWKHFDPLRNREDFIRLTQIDKMP